MLDFSELLQKRTEDFSGREWVFEQIDAWLDRPQGKRFFVLSGEPGSGKSAIAARLAQISAGQAPPYGKHLKPGFLAYSHFCEYNRSASINPLRFTESLSEALSECYPTFREALLHIQQRQSHTTVEQKADLAIETAEAGANISVNTAKIYISNLNARPVYDQYVHQPLEVAFSQAAFSRDGARPVVILVDSLNEAQLFGQAEGEGETGKAASRGENIVDLLARSEGLPRNVLFLLTSRPDKPLLTRFKGAVKLPLELKKYVKKNDRDIAGYIRDRLKNDPLLIEKTATQPEEIVKRFIDQLTRQGNFLYTTFVVKAVALGNLRLDQLAGLPGGLPALYKDFLDTALARKSAAWDLGYAQIAGVLAVAQDNLTTAQLLAFSGQSEPVAKHGLEGLRQFLEETIDGEETGQPVLRYRLYHQSMAEFFQVRSIQVEDEWIENPYPVNVAGSHAAIVKHYRGRAETWAEVGWKDVDDYGLQYLAAHLFSLRDQAEYALQLYGLVNPGFRQAKLERFYSHLLFAQDVNLAIQVCQGRQPPDLPQLIRLCLVYSGLLLSSRVTPPEALAALACLGEMPRALGMAALQSTPDEQFEAYLVIGAALIETGEFEHAQQALEKATEVSKGTGDRGKRDEAFKLLAQTLAAQGQFDQAQQTCDQIDMDWFRRQARIAVAVALAKAGQNETAFKLAQEDASRDYSMYAQVLEAIYTTQGLPAALHAADQFPDSLKGDVLYELEQSLLKSAQLDQALSVAAAHPEPSRRPGLYAEIATRLAEAGQISSAWEVAGKIEGESYRDNTLGQILASLARREGLAAAQALIAQLNFSERDGALSGLAAVLAEAGELDQAAAMLHTIQDESRRGSAYQGCIYRLVGNGQAEDIAGLVTRLPDSSERDEALSRAVYVLLEKDMDEAALKLSGGIEDPYRRFLERGESLLRLAENEGLQRARDWIIALPEKDEQDLAWGELAYQMARHGWCTGTSELLQWIGDPGVLAESFQRLLFEFKSTQDWSAALALLQTAPAELREMMRAESAERALQQAMQSDSTNSSAEGSEQAWAAIDQIANSYERDQARQAQLITLAREGHITSASQTISVRFHLPEDQYRLEQLFQNLALNGLIERGMEIIAYLETAQLRLPAATGLLAMLARRSPKEALQALQAFANPEEQETITRQVTQKLFYAGRVRQALALAKMSGLSDLADDLRADAVRHYLQIGDIPRAYTLTQEIGDESQRKRRLIEVLSRLARTSGLQAVIDLAGISPETGASEFIPLIEDLLRDARPGGPEEAFARETAARLPDPVTYLGTRSPAFSSRDRAWEMLGAFYLRHSLVDRALEAARTIGPGGILQQLFIGVVKQMVRLDRIQDAVKLCDEAFIEHRPRLLAHTALEMSKLETSKLGQKSQARLLVERIYQGTGRGYPPRLANRALSRLADFYRRAGDLEEAEEVAGIIEPGDLDLVYAWIDLGWDWLERRAADPAKKALRQAQLAIESAAHMEYIARAYAELARLTGCLNGLGGMEEYVKGLMENIVDKGKVGEMLYYLARQVARPAWAERLGRIKGVLGLPGLQQAALSLISNRWKRTAADLLEYGQQLCLSGSGSRLTYEIENSLSWLGRAWMELGKPRQALEAVEWTLTGSQPGRQLTLNSPALQAIQVMRRAGRPAEAARLLRQMIEGAIEAELISKEPYQRLRGEAARTCIQLGEVELYGRLMQGFKSHPNPQTLLYTLADLADGLAQDGAPERAQEVANLAWQRAIEPDQDTSLRFALRYTLPSVLHARLAAGQPEGVEEILRQAETIPEDNHRAQAQANLAEILARAGQIDQALHLAEQAWTTAEKNLSSNFLGLYEVARAVAQVFSGQDPQRGLEVIQTTLPIARLTGSSEVLRQVEIAIQLLAAAGQRDTLWGIFEALREVGSW